MRFMKSLLWLVAACTALFMTTPARALEWVLCDTCSAPTAFAAAAIDRVGNRLGESDFYVGNPVSGRLHQVVIVARKPGGEVTGDADATSVVAEPSHDGILAVPGALEYEVLLNQRQSAGTEIHFLDIMQALKGGMVTVEDLGEPITLPIHDDFASYGGRNGSALRDHIWINQGEPIFGLRADSSLSKNALSLLFLAAASQEGSFAKCFIFNNGDLACFQVPVSASDSAAYVAGTAIDREGVAIPGAGAGSGGYQVVPMGNGNSRYGPIGYASRGALWLFCSFADGVLDHCRVQWMAE